MLRFFLIIWFILFSFTQKVLADSEDETKGYYKSKEAPAYKKTSSKPTIEIQGYYWLTDLTSKVKVTSNSIIGTDINFKDDLGIQDDDFGDIRLMWNLTSKSQLRLAYTEIDYNGSENIIRNIVFDGQTYTIGARVDTGLDIKYLRLGWIQQLIGVDAGSANTTLDLLFEVKGFLIDASLGVPSLGISESEKFIGAIPALGIIFNSKLHKSVNIFAELSGLYIGDYGYIFDAEAGIEIIPRDNFSILAGYRILSLKIENDSDYAEIEIIGPFFGATFRF
ncbi:MAG: hypothetical protein NG737_03055 [Omnitrophica bacterium]|nr:hypothetical protein [Candidatus Omnitrophota bacterium]